MTLLERINANGTTVIMATHDAGIVDRLQRRVIEVIGGRIVRDERGGGYQTQANPILSQNFGMPGSGAPAGATTVGSSTAGEPR